MRQGVESLPLPRPFIPDGVRDWGVVMVETSGDTGRPVRAPIWAGDRVRVEGAAIYLFGQTGTVLGRGHDDGRMPTWVVKLDRPTAVGIPAGVEWPAPTLVFRGESLVRLDDEEPDRDPTPADEEGWTAREDWLRGSSL